MILKSCKNPLESELCLHVTLYNNTVWLEKFNAKATTLAATIRKNFEDLGI